MLTLSQVKRVIAEVLTGRDLFPGAGTPELRRRQVVDSVYSAGSIGDLIAYIEADHGFKPSEAAEFILEQLIEEDDTDREALVWAALANLLGDTDTRRGLRENLSPRSRGRVNKLCDKLMRFCESRA